MTSQNSAVAFMAYADIPATSMNYRKGIVKDASENFTAVLLDPAKLSGSWHYGMHVKAELPNHRSSTTSSQKSVKSHKNSNFCIWRKWEDCLDLHRLLEKEMVVLEKANRKRSVKSSRIYPSERAASFESLPCGETASIASEEGLPKLSRKASLFRVSKEVVWKRHQEVAGMMNFLFSSDLAMSEDLRKCKAVREWFSYWMSDKENEGKVPLRSAPIAVPLPPARPRQESVSTVASTAASSTVASSDESKYCPSSISPEFRVSRTPSVLHSQRFSTLTDKSRPLSTLSDTSMEWDDDLDQLNQTIETFPTPPPLKDEAIRALSPSLRRRAASSDQLSRLGLMSPVPETLEATSAPPEEQQTHRAFLPSKLRHWQSMQTLRPPLPPQALDSYGHDTLQSQPVRRDPRNLSAHARHSAYRNCLFLSAPNTPNLANSSDGSGFTPPPKDTNSPDSFGAPPSDAGSSDRWSHLKPADRRYSTLARSDSSRSKSSDSSSLARLPYALSSAGHSNPGLLEPMYSSASTLGTEASEPAEDLLSVTPLLRPASTSSSGSRNLPERLINRIMLEMHGDDVTIASPRSSGGQDLIDSYTYSSLDSSPIDDLRSFEPSPNVEPKYPSSWVSLTQTSVSVLPTQLGSPWMPKQSSEPLQSRPTRARKESVQSFVSSPEQYPKPFQNRPPGQYHLPWSSPSPPRTPPADDDSPQAPTLVIKACHVPTGSIVSFRAPRSVDFMDLKARLTRKFIDSDGVELGKGSADSWRLAYSRNRLGTPPSRRNLSFTNLAQIETTSGRTRSDSGTSITSVEVDQLTYITTSEEWISVLSACTGKLTLHIVE